ncbi:MAG TPA: class I SAM-dependent methyltransferase [Tepidisphaeraceae bacterium]|nr:class I SAM-dependent methyltransferase [Tepidisphaeraceae bacterium]
MLDPQPIPSVRAQYERIGADAWYETCGSQYRNPHEPIVARLIEKTTLEWKLDLTDVLDLAAGSGEATLALRSAGAKRVRGIDPYTADAYLQRTGQRAQCFTFADIAAGALADCRFSLIVCSFAMHLCEPSRLPGLLHALGRTSDTLLIITPHKRPVIRRQWGWELAGECMLDRVRARLYRTGADRDVD